MREPAADLRRIAFLLERANASTYKVKAFRTAAAAVIALDPVEIAGRVEAGTLKELSGVGDSTAGVIAASVAGEEPEYLRKLEADDVSFADVPLDDAATALLAELKGDLHTHSDWSDGGSPPVEMAWTARELGREYIALTDHSPRLKVANGLTAARLRKQLDVVRVINERLAPFRVLTGIEVDILDDGSLDQDPELLAELDVVVASVHSKLAMPPKAMTRRMVTAVQNPLVDVLGHCTGRMVKPRAGRNPQGRPESEFDAAAVFEACASSGVAVEINSRPERLDPPRRLVTQALSAGCLFSIDTDAHAPGQLDWRQTGASRASACGVPAERILTAWDLDTLLAHLDART
ncbi:PHP domain-containing protein [Spongisporangium articulatum]|uniref:PHP domain-containing protein n=1 Tax=Spongisporangium articulatum TaxID=3362603 RepID=A0ABW8AKW4_9ACTN